VDDLERVFSPEDFMPHGVCFLWNAKLLWLHALSDALTFRSRRSTSLGIVQGTGKRNGRAAGLIASPALRPQLSEDIAMNKRTTSISPIHEPEKTPTEIKGLDDITNAGLPKGRPTLVCGPAGCDKETLAQGGRA
jgi:KaiC